ncbi:hypothetical protein [Bacillus inaquosorum]|uniref:hypothetical protein n=1 Tax=Bacillus inaquosorum TaxID=483913 RepID=UPI000745DD5B|nr:hypothetical protein [Bacillus inaquosorum]PPA35980.1 Tat pathway signal protein [Bacillus subtilis]AMA54586.1 Tat pathway signal protein [Bacillus inaquosorum]MBT2193307.1 Tat pathway signal protein [Bacillus inaquosorum]MBT3119971.1 Tat pathway signal protein [Bacillus inaquosorum]MBT3124388.1 Tat pathway signal protein [Bacillus inaquosorum]
MGQSRLPSSVIVAMASKKHRLWHYLWHGFRNSWEGLDCKDREKLCKTHPNWVPPRPALDADGKPKRDNDSGEDFLFMHRTMIMIVNKILADEGDINYPWVQGWRYLPKPSDQSYPILPAYDSHRIPRERLELEKSVDRYWSYFSGLEKKFTDPDYLSSVTLGQLGSDIEFTIHNSMHIRWSEESKVGYMTEPKLGDPIDDIWNQPEYNWLGDEYSAHVHPIFWKLHGWVDDRINDWMRINQKEDYKWKGTWIGDTSILHLHDDHGQTPTHGDHELIANLEYLAGFLGSTGRRRSSFDLPEIC